MSQTKQQSSGPIKEWITLGFSRGEDTVYVGLGLLLGVIAITLLVTEVFNFGSYVLAGTLTKNIVFILDRLLLIIIFVEILYTVQVSFRQHILQPEPFLVVGLIAVTRRILVLTAEVSGLAKDTQTEFFNAMIELGLLTLLIISLVVSLRLLKQRERSGSGES